jgi:transmembrane sensor
MKNNNVNINYPDEESTRFFSKGKIVWEKTETENWRELSEKINSAPDAKETLTLPVIIKYVTAAILFILISLSFLTFFYSKTIETKSGEHLLVSLPGDSFVDLNAESFIKYYPLQWVFKREIQFEGEGFFSVQKGSTFKVISDKGITSVLGTSFNVYSRDEDYKVTCLTGQVNVISNTDQSVLLMPETHVEIKDGRLVIDKKYKTDWALAWRKDQFFFSGTPLKEVFKEIERQYGVTIKIQPELKNRNFAGNFQKKYNVEKVLDDICKTMQISYEKSSESVFLIRKNS